MQRRPGTRLRIFLRIVHAAIAGSGYALPRFGSRTILAFTNAVVFDVIVHEIGRNWD